MPDGRRACPSLLEDLERGGHGREPVLAVLEQVLVLPVEPRSQEVQERLLRLGDPRRVVGASEDHVAAGDSCTLPDEVIPERRGHVLERIEGTDRVEGAVLEGQLSAAPEHQPLDVRGDDVDQLDLVGGQELPQERGAAPHVKDSQPLAVFPHALEERPHQLVALELVKGEV